MHNIKIPALITIFLLTGCARWNEEVAANQKRVDERRALEAQEKIRLATPLTEEQKQAAVQKEKDMAVCQYEAAKATGSSPRGYSSYTMMFSDMTDTFRQAELLKLCMKSKGY